jgi:hypothetical protein
MMESVLDFIILKFILWIFPSRKIEDVSVGIRAILDPRTRLLVPNTSIEAKHTICRGVIATDI